MSKFRRVASTVALEDIARAAGVHRSTVSLALRDHPRISKEVRERIQRLAEEMGYRVNPLVAALMQSRRSGKKVRDVVLAYVTNYSTRYGWRPQYHDRPDYFPGAAARALELGYKLEHFWLAEPGMTPERLSDILTVRGIHGVLVGRLPPGQKGIRLLWERFSCVALGLTMLEPNLHRVAEDHFVSAGRALDRMLERGYRRIGFVFSDIDDSPAVGDRLLGAYLRRMITLGRDSRIDPYYYVPDVDPVKRFKAWYDRWKPDSLIVTHARPVMGWLTQLGISVPEQIAVVTLTNHHLEDGCSGIRCEASKLGGLGVEMLVGLMHRGETGVPADPHEVLLGGDWIDGRTVRH